MESEYNSKSDEKMKSESNTERNEKMKSVSTADSDIQMMSDSNTSNNEEKKDTVPELKSAEAVAKEKGKGKKPIIIQKTKRLTLEVPEEVNSSHSLKSRSNWTDVMDMDVVPTKAADHKRKGMEKKSDAESVKADTEQVCKKGRKDDKDARKIKIFNLESGLEEINLDTSLFDGAYETVPVMVRVVPIEKENFDEKIKIHWLCENENIVRLYAVESDERYNYIAFEKCDYTLEECVANSKTPKAELIKLLMGVVGGLKHLNKKSVIHGNLKASNIMIKEDGDNMTAKICGLENCSHPEDGEDPRLDMRDLGMIFLECLTDDTGFVKLERKKQEKMVNTKLAKLLSTFKEAYDIISMLLNHRFYPRLTYSAVYLHPIFWSWSTRLAFLVDSCEILKKLKKDSPILNEINELGSILFNKKWTEEINQDWYNSMKNAYTEDVYGLLKIIRDTNNHLLDIKPDDWDREQLESYITGWHPTLMMNVRDVLKVHCSENRLLKVYFRERL